MTTNKTCWVDPDKLRDSIEGAWRSRAESQGLGRRDTITYKRKEIEFFMGASAALNAVLPAAEKDRLGPLVPVAWVINIVSGRNVVEVEKTK